MLEEKPRIYLQGVGKKFNLNLARKEGTLFRCLSFLKKENEKNEFWALKNIDLSPHNGKIQGIIGKNGSGKSTLLKIIAGIYQADEGKVHIKGKIIYLAGFGQGIMPKLTMKENIYLIGTLLGLNKKEIDDKYKEIVEFSGLQDYENAKIYQFSSGMVSRLSFSTTIFCIKHKNPDIILIDEALDAGADLTFKEKALKKIEELINRGSNVILASHDLETVKKYCHEVLWIDRGTIIKSGPAKKIVSDYIKSENKQVYPKINADQHKYFYEIDPESQSTQAWILRFIGNNKKVLELGAGPGSITRHLKKAGCSVTAVEKDPHSLFILEPLCEQVINADLNTNDWAELVSDDGPFDVVVLTDVLEHLLNPLALLNSVKPLLSSTGYLVLSLPNITHAAILSCLYQENFRYSNLGLLDDTHIRFFGIKNIQQLIETAGFCVLEAKFIKVPPENTEFADMWVNLDKNTQETFLNRPYANVYQIILKVVPKNNADFCPINLLSLSVKDNLNNQ